jgi:hypothetical protein
VGESAVILPGIATVQYKAIIAGVKRAKPARQSAMILGIRVHQMYCNLQFAV